MFENPDINVLKTGDPVLYRGHIYWIVRGPIITGSQVQFRISKLPPERTVSESELQPIADKMVDRPPARN